MIGYHLKLLWRVHIVQPFLQKKKSVKVNDKCKCLVNKTSETIEQIPYFSDVFIVNLKLLSLLLPRLFIFSNSFAEFIPKMRNMQQVFAFSGKWMERNDRL